MTEILDVLEVPAKKPPTAAVADAPIQISVYNKAVTPIGDLQVLVNALQHYVDNWVTPVWHTTAKLTVTSGPVAGTWGFVFMDDADAPGALAYHEDDGSPLAKVFVRTVAQNNEPLSVAASHELVEMLVDPTCDRTVTEPNGTILAYEAADPVESNTFMVYGFQMSDFVHPPYFDRYAPAGLQFDQCGALSKPFELALGGYQSVFVNGAWTEIFGSLEKKQMFAREDRRGHRSEYRRYKSWHKT